MPVPETTPTPSARPSHLWVVPPDGHPDAPQADPAPAADGPAVDQPVDQLVDQPVQGGVAPLAPLDVRLRRKITALVADMPLWSERPPSYAESIEHSMQGDWATHPSAARRAVHAFATLIAFVITYPADLIVKYRVHPIGFLIVITLLYLGFKIL